MSWFGPNWHEANWWESTWFMGLGEIIPTIRLTLIGADPTRLVLTGQG